jgi:predicted ATPase
VLETLAIANYRSLRELVVPLGPLNVVTGANGSGKSSLYRALRLLADTAQGGVIASLAREGGLPSTLWAGPETTSRRMRKGEVPVQGGPRKQPVRLRLGFAAHDFGYAIDLGLPQPMTTAFGLDPEIKRECIFGGPLLRLSTLLVDRHAAHVRVRRADGEWDDVVQGLSTSESVLAEIGDPTRTPEVLLVRDRVRSWRFYDSLRTDADAPARQMQIGTRTPVLAHDGRDLAAALQTIREVGDEEALAAAIDDAFPGALLHVRQDGVRLGVELEQPGLLRPLAAAELSDGTLRYLLWIAALLTPRPPELMVLNEPETSLHPDLLPALARLIARASRSSQIWIVSHAAALVAALREDPECRCLELYKELGQTRIVGFEPLDGPAWAWPSK